METRISDFALVRKALQLLCHRFDQEFLDIPLVFIEGPSRHENGVFYIESTANLAKTMFSVFFLYLRYYLPGIPDEDKASANSFFLSVIRDFNSGTDKTKEDDEVITMRLNQFPVVWLMLKNLICPLRNIPLRNFRIIAGHSGKVDAAVYLTEVDLKSSNIPSSYFPFIFVNLDINSEAIQSAYLLIESLRGLLSQSSHDTPEDVIRGIFSDFLIKDKMVSFVKMVLSEKEEADFFAVLSILCHSEDLENLARESREKNVKEAQSLALTGPWWFSGLTEKMLEPARSEDWTVTEMWRPVTQELWTKVERERKRQGLDEVPFEMLLRIQSDDSKTDATKTLQALLAEDRIW